MKKLMIALMLVTVSTALVAAPRSSKARGKTAPSAAASAEEPALAGRDGQVDIPTGPKLGSRACLNAPQLQGESTIGKVWTKERKWIVLELKYDTYARFHDSLTFTWHVLLDSKTAAQKGSEDIAPYSYFTTQVTYQNVPKGTHAASAVLAPSYRERFGEPAAIGVVITDKNGAVVGGNSWCEVQGIKSGSQFWADPKIMDAPNGKDGKMIEQRSGLVDRAKTIWALVNPNDYEGTVL